jgi:hypothetical protein
MRRCRDIVDVLHLDVFGDGHAQGHVGEIAAGIEDGRVSFLDYGELVGLDAFAFYQVGKGDDHVFIILEKYIGLHATNSIKRLGTRRGNCFYVDIVIAPRDYNRLERGVSR